MLGVGQFKSAVQLSANAMSVVSFIPHVITGAVVSATVKKKLQVSLLPLRSIP